MPKVHIFWDNSNIHFVGRNNVMPKKEPNEDPVLFRSYFKNLFILAHRGRDIGKVFMVGSIPPKNSSLWTHVESLGITVELLERTAKNKEVGVDQTLQNSMFRTAFQSNKGDIFVVLTGDGAGEKLGKGFLHDLKLLYNNGFNIELISWENGCHGELQKFVKSNGLFIPLENYYYEVTYIKNVRRAKETIDFSDLGINKASE
ncbi:NYN domain-containing protein [Anoxybacteroides rupiense]|uniref:NYN domain-containing protein n=1 Tax=Anoxybacteroides rupiense TaxID=311460 RepID=UPI003670863D